MSQATDAEVGKMERFVFDDIRAVISKLGDEPIPTERTFFAYWAWWEALGKPSDYYGERILVLCPQDNKWHTPKEIEKMGWERSEE